VQAPELDWDWSWVWDKFVEMGTPSANRTAPTTTRITNASYKTSPEVSGCQLLPLLLAKSIAPMATLSAS